MESQKLIDLSYLEQVCGGNKSMVAKMIDMFVEHTPIQLGQMKSTAEEKNWDEFFKVAHKTKSSMAMMGVKSLATAMENLEEYSKNKIKLELIDPILKHVEETCEYILVEIGNDYANLG